MRVPSIIRELVERFRDNKESYRASAYKEFRLRREFVDSFLEALGWDVTNKSGYAEAYKDVVHEDSIRIGGASKAPDYAIRIGGTRKFFVETKAPSISLRDNSDAAYQLRRYGWSAKLSLSILTNFAEFAVYDCRIKPNVSDKASAARVLYTTFENYTGDWEKIATIFSKTAIAKGSFDRYSEDMTRKRGTAEVDAAFLTEIEGWREALAKNIASRNAGISVRELNTAVQRTIDRIIFLRIAEDRGIEQYGRLRDLALRKDVYVALANIFRQADRRYNSGLFHFDPSDGSSETLDTFTLQLSIDDRVLKEILRSLYYPDSPYEFQVFPADILGQVYEQFLGRVIRLVGKSAIVEEKPEVKKAGGVFYTPTFVVRYIVKQVLTPLLEGQTPAQIGGLDKRKKDAAPMRILDPACGSGSFLIEVYQTVLDWYRDRYVAEEPEKHAKGRRPKLYRDERREWRLTIAERRRILLDHIYGVDIDQQAVEVTKLSLLLKVLEGENADLIAAQMSLFQMRALPDLGSNIKCGNSLVGHDFYEDRQSTIFSENARAKINAFGWEEEFAFKFDALVGNPPYGGDYTQEEKLYFQSRFTYRKGKPETYLFFVEQGMQLLRPEGLLGCIVPNAWLTNFYGLQVRDLLLNGYAITCVTDLEPVKVFKATVDTCVVIVKNAASTIQSRVTVARSGVDRTIRPEFRVRQSQWKADPEKIFNVYASESDLRTMTKMASSGQTLRDIVEYSQGVIPYKTKEEGARNLHIGNKQKDHGWKPLLESAEQVEEFRVAQPDAFIHYGRWLWCAREPRFFERPKILFHRLRKKLPRQLVGAMECSGAVNRHALSNLILLPTRDEDELWAVLALFNSDMVNWWFVKRYGPLMEVGGFKVEKIPLPKAWDAIWPALAEKAKSVTAALTSAGGARDEHVRAVREREAQRDRKIIEKLLAKAYGLTSDEVAHVDESFGRALVRQAEAGQTHSG
jgi:type I restriction-modification system DNA methylase subunit/predicted type IV restriction endonuclease